MKTFLIILNLGGFVFQQIEAFSSPPALSASLILPQSSSSLVGCSSTCPQRLPFTAIYALDDNDDEDDDDDDDDEIETSNLQDWRKFRASLIDGGLPGEKAGDDSSSSTTSKKKKSVAAENEALLEQQNKALAEEYKTGVWAHTIGQPEVGGLLCRMPIESEIYNHGTGYWKEKLDLMMKFDNDGGKPSRSVDEDPEGLSNAKVNHWFQMTERMIIRGIQSITSSGKVKNGILNPNDLDENERLLMDKYMDYKQTWQEICLVLADSKETGLSEAVIINRPITKNINTPSFAKMLLEGSDGSGVGSFAPDFVDSVVRAFTAQAAVYMGGPDFQDKPALLIHGIADLPGAREVAPGTGIYRGGMEAAVEGVLEGKYQPLDFRFFVGRQSYEPGALLKKVKEGKYQPVACARSLALKQCLGLPKPLWHEVLELCGGEMKSLSSIELRKRIDLQQ